MNNARAFLKDHPIFSHPGEIENSLNLSVLSQPSFNAAAFASSPSQLSESAGNASYGRRSSMVIRDAELIVAVGSEIRMTSLEAGPATDKSYIVGMTLRTSAVCFDIHQVALNPSGKLLAAAGRTQVAVVVLPHHTHPRLSGNSSDSKSLSVGSFYHAPHTSAAIAKIEWHPWGEAGTSLLVMTADGKLREYDVSANPEDPAQIVSFVSERKSHSFAAEDPSGREVVSFALGKGRGDWASFTVYALMRNGDVHAMCPFMPMNASVPSSTLFALEGFVSAKHEFSTADQATSRRDPPRDVAAMYSKQRKYVSELLRQLAPEVTPDAVSQPVSIRAPVITKKAVARQGPFLLQPSPRLLSASDVPDASDMACLNLGASSSIDEDTGTERLGVLLLAYQDGRVDVCLDLEKVEAQWETSESSQADLPMLATYETIDLGILRQTTQAVRPAAADLESSNFPVLVSDPSREEALYVYHALGVHSIDLSRLANTVTRAMRTAAENDDGLLFDSNAGGAIVAPLVSTVIADRWDPVVAASLSTDILSASTMIVLTQSLRTASVQLTQASVHNAGRTTSFDTSSNSAIPQNHAVTGVESPGYIPLLGATAFTSPPALQTSYAPLTSQITLPITNKGQFALSSTTLRQLTTTVDNLKKHIHEVQLAHRQVESRAVLQRQELAHQQDTHTKLLALLAKHQERQNSITSKLEAARVKQQQILGKTGLILRAMVMRASPELSENETRWFGELNRMRQEILGADKYDDRSLNVRTDILRREVDRLVPRLKDVQTGESARWKVVARLDQLGTSQALHFTKRSQDEFASIQRLEQQVVSLAAKMDVGLGKAPSTGSASTSSPRPSQPL